MDIHLSVENDRTGEVLKLIDSGINKALSKSGLSVEKLAKFFCHVDTGRLRSSITHQVDPVGKKVVIGTNVEYAIYHHEGTYRTRANRFLTDALEDNSMSIAQCFEDSLG